MKLLYTEFLKMKNSNVLIPIVLLPVLSVVFGTINYAGNIEILKKEWISLWTQVYLFYGLFFLPGLIGIVCSYQWSCEHSNGNIKLLLTSTKPLGKIILSKMMVAMIIILATQSLLFLFYFISGSFFAFKTTIPVMLIKYLVFVTVLSISIVSMQMYISLKIKNFAIPVVVAIIYSFIGMLLTAKMKMKIFSYLFSMSTITSEMNKYPEINFQGIEYMFMFIISLIISLVFLALQRKSLKKNH